MNKIQALNQFWNVFASGEDWKAYDATSVPETASDKRITYEATSDEFGYPVAQTANLWDKSTSWEDITLKEMEISDYIGRGGLMIMYDDGAMWIKKANPWAQRLPDEENIKRVVLNIEVEFID